MKCQKYFVDNLMQANKINGPKMVQSKCETPPAETDEITKAIGPIGKWQIFMIALMFLSKFPVAFHQMSIIFLAPPVKFQCESMDLTEPVSNHTDNYVNNFKIKCSASCERYGYDRSIFQETIVTEWNLVCDREWLKDFTQTIFMFGILIGNLVFGHLADSYGRRRPLLVATIVQLLSGVASAYAADWFTFTAIRFALAVSTGGTIVISFVIIMEIVGVEHREAAGTLFQIPFNLGHLFLAGFGYYIRDWHMFQLAISLPSMLMLCYYWFVLESPRWLMTSGQTEKAVEIMEKVAKCNKLPTNRIKEDMHTMSLYLNSPNNSRGAFLDLFNGGGLWVKTLCISFNWLVCGLCLFGVSHYVGQTSGNIFINVAISASVQIPGTIIAVFLNKSLGRKMTLMLGNCLAGVSCLLIAAMPEIPLSNVLLAAMGILGMSISFPTVYLYAGEIFPTVVRNSGVGFCSMAARIGSMAAPFVAGLAGVQFWLPPIIFGVFPLIGAALCTLLPETKGKNLTNTLQESDKNNIDASLDV